MDNTETKIDHLISEITANPDIEAAIRAFQLLSKLFTNIIENFTEDKFKNFKTSNDAIKTKILAIPESIDLIKAVGYVKTDDELYVYKETTSKNLEFAIELFAQKLCYLDYKLTKPKTPPSEASTQNDLPEGTYPIKLLVYDISNGMARQMSPMLLKKTIDGIYHTGISIYGIEYYYGGGICQGVPKKTPYGYPIKEINLGGTEIPKELLMDYLDELKGKYAPEKYHIINNNCNHFTNDVAFFLTGNNIPDYILNQHKELSNTPIGNMILPMLEKMNVPQMIEGRR